MARSDVSQIHRYVKLVKDAEWRVGAYLSGGGHEADDYVQRQLARIKHWNKRILRILESDDKSSEKK